MVAFGWLGAGGGVVGMAVAWSWRRVTASRAVDPQRRAASDGFAWTALIPVSAAAAMSVPGQHSGWHAVAAVCAGLAWVVLLVVFTDRHLTAVAALLTVGVFARRRCWWTSSGWQVPPQRVAVVALFVVLGLVTFATNLGVIGSGVPGPWFPSVTGAGVFANVPGTPRDTVSPVYPAGTESPAEIAAWTRRGNSIVTGVCWGAVW